MTKPVRITQAEIERAKCAAEGAGVKLVGLEKRPDGSLRLEFGEFDMADWRQGSPLYERAQ